MTARFFDKELDFPTYQAWSHAHNAESDVVDLLPPIGFVVNETAIGFLVVGRECAQCYIENVVTDPEAQPLQSGRAVEQLVELLLEAGRQEGCQVVTFETRIPSVKRLAERLGARPRADLVVFQGRL